METNERLHQLLVNSVKHLRLFANEFDGGDETMAKEMAVKVRVLLHDTDSSKSLLTQLGIKTQLAYVDTAIPINPENLFSSLGLVIAHMRIANGVNLMHYIAPLAEHLSPDRLSKKSPFDVWWSENIMKDLMGNMWSRKDLVLVLANKEGGAHVQPQSPAKYTSLADENSLGVMGSFEPEDLKHFEGNPAEASMRQIVYELLTTLESASISTSPSAPTSLPSASA